LSTEKHIESPLQIHPGTFAPLKPSANIMISAMSTKSGTIIETGRRSAWVGGLGGWGGWGFKQGVEADQVTGYGGCP